MNEKTQGNESVDWKKDYTIDRDNKSYTGRVTDPYMLKPTLTADGREWVQRCFICAKPVDFLKTTPDQRVKVDNLVRHAKCKNYL